MVSKREAKRDAELEQYINREDAIERYTYAALMKDRKAMREALEQIEVPACTCGLAKRPLGSHHYVGCELADWVKARREDRLKQAAERRQKADDESGESVD